VETSQGEAACRKAPSYNRTMRRPFLMEYKQGVTEVAKKRDRYSQRRRAYVRKGGVVAGSGKDRRKVREGSRRKKREGRRTVPTIGLTGKRKNQTKRESSLAENWGEQGESRGKSDLKRHRVNKKTCEGNPAMARTREKERPAEKTPLTIKNLGREKI